MLSNWTLCGSTGSNGIGSRSEPIAPIEFATAIIQSHFFHPISNTTIETRTQITGPFPPLLLVESNFHRAEKQGRPLRPAVGDERASQNWSFKNFHSTNRSQFLGSVCVNILRQEWKSRNNTLITALTDEY
jgi:hypothetical protein